MNILRNRRRRLLFIVYYFKYVIDNKAYRFVLLLHSFFLGLGLGLGLGLVLRAIGLGHGLTIFWSH